MRHRPNATQQAQPRILPAPTERFPTGTQTPDTADQGSRGDAGTLTRAHSWPTSANNQIRDPRSPAHSTPPHPGAGCICAARALPMACGAACARASELTQGPEEVDSLERAGIAFYDYKRNTFRE